MASQIGIMFGGNGSDANLIATSTDFNSAWTPVTVSGAHASGGFIQDVIGSADGHAIFLFGNIIALSTDGGVSFSEVLAPPGDGSIFANGILGGHCGVILDSGRAVVSADHSTPGNTSVFYADAPYSSWSQVAITYPTSRTNGLITSMATDGTDIIAIGYSLDLGLEHMWMDVYRSTDGGAVWNNPFSVDRGAIGTHNLQPSSIMYNGSQYVIVNHESGFTGTAVTTSSDGVSWTDNLTPGFTNFAEQFWSNRFWDPVRSCWILVDNVSVPGNVWKSTDGSNYTSIFSSGVNAVYYGCILFEGKYLVSGQITGGGGGFSSFAISTDGGATWNEVALTHDSGPQQLFASVDNGVIAELSTGGPYYWTSGNGGSSFVDNDSYWSSADSVVQPFGGYQVPSFSGGSPQTVTLTGIQSGMILGIPQILLPGRLPNIHRPVPKPRGTAQLRFGKRNF